VALGGQALTSRRDTDEQGRAKARPDSRPRRGCLAAGDGGGLDRLQRADGPAPAAAPAGGARRAPRARRAGRAAQLLRGRRRTAAAAGPQRQRRRLGLRGAALLRAGARASPRLRRGPARLRLFGPLAACLHRAPVCRRGARHARRDRRRGWAGPCGRPRGVARLRIRGAGGGRAARALPHAGLGHAHRILAGVRQAARPGGVDARDPGPAWLLHFPVVEPSVLRPPREPAEHPLLPAAHLRVEGDRRGPA
jgi:hypothetical protein